MWCFPKLGRVNVYWPHQIFHYSGSLLTHLQLKNEKKVKALSMNSMKNEDDVHHHHQEVDDDDDHHQEHGQVAQWPWMSFQ